MNNKNYIDFDKLTKQELGCMEEGGMTYVNSEEQFKHNSIPKQKDEGKMATNESVDSIDVEDGKKYYELEVDAI